MSNLTVGNSLRHEEISTTCAPYLVFILNLKMVQLDFPHLDIFAEYVEFCKLRSVMDPIFPKGGREGRQHTV